MEQLICWCGGPTEPLEIYAWSPNDHIQLLKECRFKQIETPLLGKTAVWNDFQEEYRQILGDSSIISLSEALRRTKLNVEGELHDASWDALNSSRLMAVARTEAFRREVAAMHRFYCHEAPRSMGGLKPETLRRLAALLSTEEACTKSYASA